MPTLPWPNCVVLLLPVLLWNAAFTARLPQAGFRTDVGVPRALLLGEQLLRLVVFAWPLVLPLELGRPGVGAGLAVYAAGLLTYCAAWLPLIYAERSRWSTSLQGLLAPAYTPLVWLIGIAITARSFLYGVAALCFVAVHLYHNLLVLGSGKH